MSFTKAAEEYKKIAQTKYRAHPSSFKRIQTSLASAIVYFDIQPVSSLDAGAIEDYMTWRVLEHKVKDITVRHDLHALSKFFAVAIRKHWAASNPIREVDIPSDAEAVRIHPLTVEEESEYFRRAAQHQDLHDLGRLMINQGMRPEEVTSLAKVDLDLGRGLIHIRRGKSLSSKRSLQMTAESHSILESRMAGDALWIFPSSRKPGMPVVRLNSAHDKVVARAAKDGNPLNFVMYDFRHTFATRAAQSGMDLPTLAAILGHGSIRCLRCYVHPTDAHKHAAMKRIDRAQKKLRKDAAAY
jgi:integrase